MNKKVKTALIVAGGITITVIGIKIAAYYTIPYSYRDQPILYWLDGCGLGKHRWWRILESKLSNKGPNYIFEKWR